MPLVEYIDDRSYATSLEYLKDNIIKSGYVVNLANNKVLGVNEATIATLKSKLQSYHIPYNAEAFYHYTLKSARRIQQEILDKGWENIIGIEACGIASDKHIGYLDDYLLENSEANILYLCATPHSLFNINQKIKKSHYKERMYAVCFPLEHTEELGFLSVLCKTSLNNTKNKSVPTIYLGHALSDWSKIDFEKYYADRIDYLTLGLNVFRPKKLETIEALECGYLGFDLMAKEIDRNVIKDSVVFAPYNQEEFFKFLPLMCETLSKYRVVYRDRTFFEGTYKWQKALLEVEKLKSHSHFAISDSCGIASDVYNRCFAFVGGISTSINTFPILSLAPSISDNTQLNEEIGIKINLNIKEFLDTIDNIYLNLNRWVEKIEKYRRSNVYNFGFSSEVLGEFIISNFLRRIYGKNR